MKQVIVQQNEVFGPWVMSRIGGNWVPGMGETIGLFDTDNGIVACCMYESCNGASVMMHVAGEGNWLNREFLWFVFYYPFVQLGVRKIISPINSENTKAVRFCTRIGFSLEATLKDASPQGDILIFSLEKDQCKWLSLKDDHGQAQSTGNP